MTANPMSRHVEAVNVCTAAIAGAIDDAPREVVFSALVDTLAVLIATMWPADEHDDLKFAANTYLAKMVAVYDEGGPC